MKLLTCIALLLMQTTDRVPPPRFCPCGGIRVDQFGALPDGRTDSYAAITSAIGQACTAVTSSTSGVQGSTIYFPGGIAPYRYSRVPVINCSNLTMHGDRLASRLLPSYDFGPPLVIHPPIGSGYIAVPTQASLVDGPGNAMTLSRRNQYWISLRDAAEIDGLSALTIEFFTQLSSVGADGNWIASYGRRTVNENATSALQIGMSAGGQWSARLNVGGTQYALAAPVGLTVDTLYHIALSYDGSQIRLFLNGTQMASQAASGTVTEALTENFTVGPILSGWPEGAVLGNSVDGAVDSIRISNVARYPASFATPSAKFSNDSGTLALLNFDDQYDAFTVGSANGRDHNAHFFLRYTPNNGAITDVELSDLYFDNGTARCGPMIRKTNASRYRNLEIRGGTCGLWLQDKDYETQIDYYVFRASTTHTRFDLAFTNASGVSDIVRPLLFGGRYQFVDAGDQPTVLRSGWFQTESNTIAAILASGSGGQTVKDIRDSAFNSESGGASLEALIILAGVQGSVNLMADSLQAPPAIAAMKVEGGGHINIIGGLFSGSENAPANISIIGELSSPIYLYGVSRTAPNIPWSDNPAYLTAIP